MRDSSPFTPGSPAPPDLFVGRIEYINAIHERLCEAAAGKQQNIFLSGERGIGKSSLAKYIRVLADKKINALSIHVFLGGVHDLDELVRRIFEEVLKAASNQSWFEKFKTNFGTYIQSVDVFGVTLSFQPPKEKMQSLTGHFSEAITNIHNDIKSERSSILIILDDINGISKTPEFAHWYKSFVDYAATHYDSFPLSMMLIGVPEIRYSLGEHQESLLRIFHVINIERLSDEEVGSFFTKAFSSVNIQIEPDALATMIYHASGYPILMQEIGDAIYRRDEEGIIGIDDTYEGITSAAAVIGEKYLNPKVYQAIRSKKYRSILRKMGQKGSSVQFSRREISRGLTHDEIRVFDNFLSKMKTLGIIIDDREEGRGHYRYINALYPMYIRMESQTHEKLRA